MKLDDFCQKLSAQLAARSDRDERLRLAVQALHQAFRVKPDEVAIFSLDSQAEVLAFLWPARLQKTGFIPLTSHDSLAARSARENKAFLNNRFASVHHTSIFEHVRLDEEKQSTPLPIQKILSAPLHKDGQVLGVLQISRKGRSPSLAGEDFSKTDLSALTDIAEVLAQHL